MLAPGLSRTKSPASRCSRSRLARCSAASSGARSARERHAEALDQPCDEGVGRERVELGGGGAVQREEPLDAFARLGWHLRGLGGGVEAENEVELAPVARPG